MHQGGELKTNYRGGWKMRNLRQVSKILHVHELKVSLIATALEKHFITSELQRRFAMLVG